MKQQMSQHIFQGPAQAVVDAVASYRPVSLHEYVAQVQELPGFLEQVAQAVTALEATGHRELSIGRELSEHLAWVVAAITAAAQAAGMDERMEEAA